MIGSNNMKHVILDFSSSQYRCIYAAEKIYKEGLANLNVIFDDPNELYKIYKRLLLREMIDHIKMFNPDNFIVALDSKSWRHDFYDKYKGNREKVRDDSAIDFDKFFTIANEYIAELQTIFKCLKFVKVEKSEADDTIAILCKKRFSNDDTVIIAVDKDINQLLSNPKHRRWNARATGDDKFVVVEDPTHELHLKILCGDNGDNLPSVFVLDESKYPVEGKRIGLGDVTAELILKEEKFLESDYVIEKVSKKYKTLSSNTIVEEVKANYQRNLKLIDFNHIPVEIESAILSKYDTHQVEECDMKSLFRMAMSLGENKIAADLNNLKILFDRMV